jgi:diguanylate cyclase (GGDEF)-like protein
MTKPSDFSPAEALEVKDTSDTKQARRNRWVVRVVGMGVLVLGWLAVSLHDFGRVMFVVDAIVFAAMALYAIAAAAVSRTEAVNRERRLRLRLLVHNMELENLSMRDELTQLFNRRYLFERLERELDTAKGFQRPLAYIAIEVRSLNHINHTYGYTAGDRLLAAFGQFLMDMTRATDLPARVSGNKFAVILPDTSKRGAYTTIERLTRSLTTTPLTQEPGLDAAIVTSFGVSGYPWGSDTVDAIVRQAEAEMAAPSGADGIDGTGQGRAKESAEEIPAVFRQLDETPNGS